MILDKYILKELFKSQLVVLIVLIVIFSGQSIVRLVTDAAVGKIPVAMVFSLMLYSLPQFLIFIMPLTLYVAIILSLGRICSDSEMVVMRMVGYSPMRIMMVSLLLAVISAAGVGYVATKLVPKAANAQYELELQATNNPEFLPIESGRFVTFGNYNIYIEDVDDNKDKKDINNIFVIETDPTNVRLDSLATSITIAKEGHVILDEDGVRWLVLNNGLRYDFPQDGSYRRASFDSSRAPISGNVTDETKKSSSTSRMETIELLRSDNLREQVEAQWRFSPIFATIVLCLVAVPLSMVNPRQGRFARLAPAILLYVAYYLFLLSLRNLIITKIIPIYPGLYLVPVVFAILVAIPLNLPKSHLKRIAKTKAAAPVKVDREG